MFFYSPSIEISRFKIWVQLWARPHITSRGLRKVTGTTHDSKIVQYYLRKLLWLGISSRRPHYPSQCAGVNLTCQIYYVLEQMFVTNKSVDIYAKISWHVRYFGWQLTSLIGTSGPNMFRFVINNQGSLMLTEAPGDDEAWLVARFQSERSCILEGGYKRGENGFRICTFRPLWLPVSKHWQKLISKATWTSLVLRY